jgi:hypothetical protein
MAPRRDFFNEHEERQQGHPGQAHDSHGEHDRHQSPATTDAHKAVAKAHPDGALATSMPMAGEKREGGPAVVQTRVLQCGDLIEASYEKYRCGHERSGAVPGNAALRTA